MNKLHSLLLAVPVAAFASCAGQTYRVDVGAMFAKASGDIALQNAAGSNVLHNHQNDLDRNMGLGDTEPSPYLRVQMDQELHRVRLHGFGVDSGGSGTLAGDYGNLLGGSQVTTSMDFFAVGVTYAYQLLREEHYRVAVGAAFNFYALDVAARSSAGRESVKTNVVVPMPYAEVEGFLGPVTAGANAGLMSADLGDANGRYLDIEAYVRWQATEQFDAMIGYRYVVLDGYGRASSRDFDADIDVQGFFVSGGVRF
jgi:hypothetical protein